MGALLLLERMREEEVIRGVGVVLAAHHHLEERRLLFPGGVRRRLHEQDARVVGVSMREVLVVDDLRADAGMPWKEIPRG